MKRKKLVLAVIILTVFAAGACSRTESTQITEQVEEVASEEQRTGQIEEDRQEVTTKANRNEAVAKENGNMESEDAVRNEENNKSKVLNLFYTEPLMSKLVWTQTSALTKVEGESWIDVLQFSPSEVGTIAAYEAGGQYTVLKAKIAPEEDWEDDDIARIIIYGDGDVVLYESPDITKDTAAFAMEADISGLQAVSIKAVSIEGGSGHIILKDAVFE